MTRKAAFIYIEHTQDNRWGGGLSYIYQVNGDRQLLGTAFLEEVHSKLRDAEEDHSDTEHDKNQLQC